MDSRIHTVTRAGLLLSVIVLFFGGCAITKDIEASRNRDKLRGQQLITSQYDV